MSFKDIRWYLRSFSTRPGATWRGWWHVSVPKFFDFYNRVRAAEANERAARMHIEQQEKTIQLLDASVLRLERTVRHYKAKSHNPEAEKLLADAKSLISEGAGGIRQNAYELRTWLSEYRSYKFERQAARADYQSSSD